MAWILIAMQLMWFGTKTGKTPSLSELHLENKTNAPCRFVMYQYFGGTRGMVQLSVPDPVEVFKSVVPAHSNMNWPMIRPHDGSHRVRSTVGQYVWTTDCRVKKLKK